MGTQEAFTELFKDHPVPMWIYDLATLRFLEVNEAACRVYGHDREAFLSMDLRDIRPPEDLARLEEDLAQPRGTYAASGVWRHRARDGRTFFVEITSHLVSWEGRGAAMVMARDVSAEHMAREELRISEMRLRTLVESAPVAIFVTRAGQVLYANAKAAEAFGLVEAERLIGLSVLDFFAPGAREKAEAQALAQFPGRPEPFEFESAGLRADGSTFPLQASVSPAALPNGPALILFLMDLTERARLEAQQRELQAHLMHTSKMESLGRLAGGVAHDMNNVLGAILSLASVHQERAEEGSGLQGDMDTIVKACLRGRSLVQGLLGFARKDLSERRRLDLNVLVREEVALLEHATLRKVRLEMALEDALRPVLGDPSALSSALMNLCVNAVDAMPQGGVLQLRTSNAPPDAVLLEVRDTGVGMTREVMEKALDPFFSTKPRGQGTGLGLAIAYGTVQAHKGRIEIQSEPGRGTAILIRLPAV